ncbi:RnfABCDGE type electron transport complex subunit B [candidate division WOR-3 bacterium]|nr:RnfABCDGE type electron transport complex subunit B [candidate division WOR-3 bacterium]
MASILIPIGILGGIALFFGTFLVISAEKFKVEVDKRVGKIIEALPGIDCGACGAPGCSAFAEGVVEEKYPVNGCKVGGQEVADEIAEILGVEAGEVMESVAVLRCLGTIEVANRIAEYQGIETCAALDLLGGDKGCHYGCLGLGDCVEACPFNAIIMKDDGLPYVIEERCTACGECVRSCPRGLFELIGKEQDIYLACISKGDAKEVKKVCSMGCVGCSLCARVIENEIITMDGNLPVIHWEKIEDNKLLEPALEKCPTKTFIRRSEYV